MPENKLIPRDKLDDFVQRLREAAGSNLQSVVLYGSAVRGDFDPQYSDLNLLCIVGSTSFAALEQLAPAITWWTKQKQRSPLLMSREELGHATDVFSIELTDMRADYQVLFGEDVLQSLEIPMRLHRAQVEYELREKLILLRQHLILAAGHEQRMWELLIRALPSFTTLFRHASVAMGGSLPETKGGGIATLAERLGFDASVFQTVLQIREHKSSTKQHNVNELAARYLAAVEHVTAAVDKILDSPAA